MNPGRDKRAGGNFRHRSHFHQMIDRRTFVAGAAATLVAAPRLAWAQRDSPIRLALVSGTFTAEKMTESGALRWRVFFEELRRLGLIEGENLIVERWSNAGRHEDELPDLAGRMVASRPDLIFVHSCTVVATVKSATAATIPIVFVCGNPVEWGIAESLRRPGGNLTGFAAQPGPEINLKSLQLLREAVPGAEPVALLVTRRHYETNPGAGAVREGAPRLGISLKPAFVEEPVDEQSIGRALAALPEWPNRVMFVFGSAEFTAKARAIAAEALKAGIPAIAHRRDYAEAGLLMTYGRRHLNGPFRGAAGYVARVARGEDPAEMPIPQPTEFDLVINLKTAEALGITLPPAIMIQAAEFIE